MTERISLLAAVSAGLSFLIWAIASLAVVLNEVIPAAWAALLFVVLFAVLFVVDSFPTSLRDLDE